MPAVGLARVEVRAARLPEAAGHLGMAQRDGQDAEPGEQRGQRAPGPGERGQHRRHPEDRAADGAVDHGRGQVPAADGADQPGRFGARGHFDGRGNFCAQGTSAARNLPTNSRVFSSVSRPSASNLSWARAT